MNKTRSKRRTAETFPVRIHCGHVLAEIGGKACVVDTGAPSTVGEGPFVLCGRQFPTEREYFGVTCDGLSGFVGTHIDFLIGTDVLNTFPWKLDWHGGTVEFYRGGHDFNGTVVHVSNVLGSPVVPFMIHGMEYEGILDTGAPLQFCPRGWDGGTYVRDQRDFFPLGGWFTSRVYRTGFRFGNREIDGEFGKMPAGLDGPLGLLGLGWILGSDVLKSGPLGFDLRRGKRKIHLM
jgi:hypothetical protein